MNTFTSKKTIGTLSAIAAAGLLTAGFAAPAMADDTTESTTTVAPETVLTGDLLDSITSDTTFADLLDGTIDGFSGDATISGLLGDVTGGDTSVDGLVGDVTGGDITGGDISNESPVVVAPEVGDIGSGNAIGSGNDVQAPIGSGNETNVDLGDVSDVADVDGIVGDVTDVVDVDGIVGDVTGSVDGLVDGITSDLDLGLGDILG